MKFDTILRASEQTRLLSQFSRDRWDQYIKFHTWLVRHDARQEREIAMLRGQVEYWKGEYTKLATNVIASGHEFLLPPWEKQA